MSEDIREPTEIHWELRWSATLKRWEVRWNEKTKILVKHFRTQFDAGRWVMVQAQQWWIKKKLDSVIDCYNKLHQLKGVASLKSGKWTWPQMEDEDKDVQPTSSAPQSSDSSSSPS